MLAKSMIAAATLIASLAAMPAAEARTSSDFNVGVPSGQAFYAQGYGARVEPSITFHTGHRGISCGQARNIVIGNGFYNVTAIDCSAPGYGFVAWQDGDAYRVRINSTGAITGVSRL